MPIVEPSNLGCNLNLVNNPNVTYPGTNQLVTHSYDERLTKVAEFDDSLLDMASWRNCRYDGSKLVAQKVNQFTSPDSTIDTAKTASSEYVGKYVYTTSSLGFNKVYGGDSSYQNLPVINNLTTALYIADTVIGGQENPQFTTLRNHSYVGISKILIINLVDDSVQVIDRASEPYHEFHRYITNDFPTGNKATVKVITDGVEVANSLQGYHRVKMNKGFLLKSFTYEYAGETSGSEEDRLSRGDADVFVENNTMYLYKGDPDRDITQDEGTIVKDNYYVTGTLNNYVQSSSLDDYLRFRFGNIEIHEGGGNGEGGLFDMKKAGPKFSSSSIHENKFTQQFYSGSYGLISSPHSSSKTFSSIPANILTTSSFHGEALGRSSFGTASKFIAMDMIDFLITNNAEATELDKTEIHLTLFQGTKDFAPGFYDERSISTFEVDQNRAQLDVIQGDNCNLGLPVNHELVLKGPADGRFMPTISESIDSISSTHLQNKSGSSFLHFTGCAASDQIIGAYERMMPGLTMDKTESIFCYVQGGALGQIGYLGAVTGSSTTYGADLLNKNKMSPANFYSGSFYWELSFLDKDHTLIIDLNKTTELYDGIGDKGLLLIPQHSHPQVSMNIDWYLQKAGVISPTSAPPIQQNIQFNTTPPGLTAG